MKALFTIGKFAATGLIGFLMLLNAQPWLKLAAIAEPMFATVPFLGALVSIPYIGGWVEFAIANLAAFLGLFTWGVLQFLEILPMAYDKENILGGLIKQWQGREYDSEKEKNKALKKLKEMFNAIPTEDVEALDKYRKWAYIIEFAGCFLLYLPYEGGWAALVDDAFAWDTDSILWPQLAMIPVSMFGFEILFKLVIRIWRLSKVAKLETVV
jgi:hypothetical protein